MIEQKWEARKLPVRLFGETRVYIFKKNLFRKIYTNGT